MQHGYFNEFKQLFTISTNYRCFSGDGVVASGVAPNVIYSLNVSLLSPGSHTVSYTYAPSPNCPLVTISDTFIVSNAACVVPFISQTYFNGNDQYIEVKTSVLPMPYLRQNII